jgi:hypothetical protein
MEDKGGGQSKDEPKDAVSGESPMSKLRQTPETRYPIKLRGLSRMKAPEAFGFLALSFKRFPPAYTGAEEEFR